MYWDPSGHSYVRKEVAPGFYSNVWVDDFKEGFKKTFFADTFESIKNQMTRDPIEHLKSEVLQFSSYIENIKSGLSDDDYNKVFKGYAGIVDKLGSTIFPTTNITVLDKIEKYEEIKKAYDEKDINKLNYLLGESVGDLSEIFVTAFVTAGISKGYSSIKSTPYKPTFVEGFIDDASKPKIVEKSLTKTSERYTVNKDVNKKFTLKGKGTTDVIVGKSDLDAYRLELGVPETNTVAIGRTNIKGLKDITFKGSSPLVRKEAGLADLDVVAPNREIKSPANSPQYTRHAEEGVINEFVNEVNNLGLVPEEVKGTLFIHQSNPRGVCTKCIQGITNPNVKPGIFLQLSNKYPNLLIKVTSETVENVKPQGRLNFGLKGGKYVDK